MCAQIEPREEQLVVSSSGDRTACIWDRRKLGPGVKALHTVTSANVILSAYFSPDGNDIFNSLQHLTAAVPVTCATF